MACARASNLSQGTDAWLSPKNKYLELKDVSSAINNIYRRFEGGEAPI